LCLGIGCLFFANSFRSRIEVDGCRLRNNFGWEGGIYEAVFYSGIEFRGTQFEGNMAYESALGETLSEGYAHFYNCTIVNNRAL